MDKEEDNNKVKELIEAEEYFNRAFQWFCTKYLNQYKDRAILILVAIALSSLLFFTTKLIFKQLNSKGAEREVYYIKTNENRTQNISVNSVPEYYYDDRDNVVRFIIQRYISEFESHNYGRSDVWKFSQKSKRISNLSSSSVNKKFSKILKNKYSKDILNKNQRYIEVVGFMFPERTNYKRIYKTVRDFLFPRKIPKRAIVSFYAYRRNTINNKIWRAKKTVELEYDISFYTKKSLEESSENNTKNNDENNVNKIRLYVKKYRYIPFRKTLDKSKIMSKKKSKK